LLLYYRIVREARDHPLGAECVIASWIIDELFHPENNIPLSSSSSSSSQRVSDNMNKDFQYSINTSGVKINDENIKQLFSNSSSSVRGVTKRSISPIINIEKKKNKQNIEVEEDNRQFGLVLEESSELQDLQKELILQQNIFKSKPITTEYRPSRRLSLRASLTTNNNNNNKIGLLIPPSSSNPFKYTKKDNKPSIYDESQIVTFDL
jgi:hypothetical protein